MGRKVKFPPSILPHKPSGQDRIRWGGKDYFLGKSGSHEAKAEYARLIVELANQGMATVGTVGTPTGLTVAEVCDRFTQHAAGEYTERGRETDQYKLAMQPLVRLYGELLVAAFGVQQLGQLQLAMATGSWLVESERGRRASAGLCYRVVNRRVVRIRTIFRWAERQGLAARGTWENLRTLPGLRKRSKIARNRPRRQPATLDEVKRVGRKAPPVVRAMLLFQWWTGCRSGEVRVMRAGQVDTSDDVWLYVLSEHKTDEDDEPRVITIGRRAQSILRPWLARAAASGPDTPVFPVSRRRCDRGYYSRDGYCQVVRRAAVKAGLPGWIPYGCRHAAKDRIARACGTEHAQAALGHRHVSTTERYGGRNVELAKAAARKVG